MENICIIGTGYMAIEYAKALKGLNKPFTVIGRGEKNAKLFEDAINIKPLLGGLEANFSQLKNVPEFVINAVGIETLKETTLALLNYNCKTILLEKPGVAYANEIDELTQIAVQKNATIVLAYNRRFYASVIEAKKIIAQDGGVASFNFEFTEWAHQIDGIKHLKTQAELQNWFLGNSTHVIDMAFYLGGFPKEIATFVTGKNKLNWHNASSAYSGAGISNTDALFSYHANWQTPGRFSVEILTLKNRLIFKPLEKLQIQKLGSVAINFVEDINYSLDETYKPGVYLQTKSFIEKDFQNFVSIQQQQIYINTIYKKMSGY